LNSAYLLEYKKEIQNTRKDYNDKDYQDLEISPMDIPFPKILN
jgi:hypothetical protein